MSWSAFALLWLPVCVAEHSKTPVYRSCSDWLISGDFHNDGSDFIHNAPHRCRYRAAHSLHRPKILPNLLDLKAVAALAALCDYCRTHCGFGAAWSLVAAVAGVFSLAMHPPFCIAHQTFYLPSNLERPRPSTSSGRTSLESCSYSQTSTSAADQNFGQPNEPEVSALPSEKRSSCHHSFGSSCYTIVDWERRVIFFAFFDFHLSPADGRLRGHSKWLVRQ